MAQFVLNGMEELAMRLERMGDMGETAVQMLQEGADVLEKEMRRQAEPHKVTGAMVRSIKKDASVRKKGGGYSITVRPRGTDKKGVRNMEKAIYLEYGVSGRPASPIMRTAVLNAEPHVKQRMMEVMERKLQG